jgi:hypothetical protein
MLQAVDIHAANPAFEKTPSNISDGNIPAHMTAILLSIQQTCVLECASGIYSRLQMVQVNHLNKTRTTGITGGIARSSNNEMYSMLDPHQAQTHLLRIIEIAGRSTAVGYYSI